MRHNCWKPFDLIYMKGWILTLTKGSKCDWSLWGDGESSCHQRSTCTQVAPSCWEGALLLSVQPWRSRLYGQKALQESSSLSPCPEDALCTLAREADKCEGQERFPLLGELGISHGIRVIYKDGQMFTDHFCSSTGLESARLEDKFCSNSCLLGDFRQGCILSASVSLSGKWGQ